MSDLPLIFLLAAISFILIWSLRKRERTIQLPFLTVVAFLGYLGPQFLSLYQIDWDDQWILFRLVISSTLFLLTLFIGYVITKTPTKIFADWVLSSDRLFFASITFVAIGFVFRLMVASVAPEVGLEHGVMWTGPITIYEFFAQFYISGFVIALVMYPFDRKKKWLIVIVFCILIFSVSIVFHGRRGPLVELVLFLVLSIYFANGWTPPRSITIGGAIVLTLLFNSIHDYRMTMLQKDRYTWSGAGLSEILRIDYVGNFVKNMSESAPDLINALYLMDEAATQGRYNYGTRLFDEVVRRYVPGQIIGIELKESLKFRLGIWYNDIESRYDRRIGTTETGIGEAFLALGYLGFIQFFLIGFMLSKLFLAANAGNVICRMIVILVMYSALRTFPMSSYRFFLEFLNVGIFLAPALLYSRIKRFLPPDNDRAISRLQDGKIGLSHSYQVSPRVSQFFDRSG